MPHCLSQSNQLPSPLKTPRSVMRELGYDRRQNSNMALLTSSSISEEHILRSTTGLDNARNRLRTSSIITNPYEEIVPEALTFHRNKSRSKSGRYSRYSPTPSIKRGKAEKLLKEHGSPPGVRVTAGGRIVPDGLSPIASPLFDARGSFKQEHSSQINSSLGYNFSSTVMPKPLNGYVVDIGNGGLCQLIDNELCPVEYREGVLQLHMPAPNLPMHSGVVPILPFPGCETYLPLMQQPDAYPGLYTDCTTGGGVMLSHKPTEREIRVMEQVHAKLEQELKDLDRHEVLQRALLNQAKRAEIVRARIALVNRIDISRRAIENVKRMPEGDPKPVYSNMKITRPGLPPLAQGPTHYAVHNIEGQYLFDQLPFQSNAFDSHLRIGAQPIPPGNGFQPNVPEFVPHRQTALAERGSEGSSALKERPQNIGLGVKIEIEGSCGSIDSKKAFDLGHVTGSMNLDGSAHLPRRSHAIEIKKPGHDATQHKASLNPTSPSYRPAITFSGNFQNSDEQGEVLSFNPSPSLVAQMDNLVQSPGRQDRVLDDLSAEPHQSSDSSATTADFFPQDAYQHSSRKPCLTRRDIQVNLPAWMPKDGEREYTESRVTPSRPPNKFVFNDESPSEAYFAQPPASGNGHTDPSRYGPRPTSESRHSVETESHASPMQESATHSWYTQALQDTTTFSNLLENASERVSGLPIAEICHTDTYLRGYRTGIRQEVLGDDKDEEYRIGYRDGLIQSSFMPSSSCTPSFHNLNEQDGASTTRSPKYRMRGVGRNPPIAKATSFPSFGGTAISVPSVPMPPANSLATTPTKYGSAKKERSPVIEAPLDSPTARADFMSQPNVNVTSTNGRVMGGNISGSTSLAPDTPSPLANRCSSNQVSETGTRKEFSFASRMQNRSRGYDQQRYQKSATSVAQTNDHARAQFPSQYDGSADDEEPLEDRITESIEANSGAKEKNKAKIQGSPVKVRASAAVATMRQAAGIGRKKEEDTKKDNHLSSRKDNKRAKGADPALMSSPEKKKWRETWAKNFRQLKKDEQEEIERYKRDNPLQ